MEIPIHPSAADNGRHRFKIRVEIHHVDVRGEALVAKELLQEAELSRTAHQQDQRAASFPVFRIFRSRTAHRRPGAGSLLMNGRDWRGLSEREPIASE